MKKKKNLRILAIFVATVILLTTSLPFSVLSLGTNFNPNNELSLKGDNVSNVNVPNLSVSLNTNTVPDGYNAIYTIEDLYCISFDLDKNYILMNDLDLSTATANGGDWDFDGRGWDPIGSNCIYADEAFSGIFDGNGHTISGININFSSLPSGSGNEICVGLFSNVTGTVKNLNVLGNIETRPYYDKTIYVGGITGKLGGIIYNCSNKTNITISTYYADAFRCSTYAGGICGTVGSSTKIMRCNNNGNIICSYGMSSSNVKYASGIANIYNATNVEIDNCYNSGSISSNGGNNAAAGIAYNASWYSTSKISNCYNIANISANGVKSCAISNITVVNCYFLNSTGTEISGAVSRSSAMLKLKNMYNGFDFNNVWVIDKDSEYPYAVNTSVSAIA